MSKMNKLFVACGLVVLAITVVIYIDTNMHTQPLLKIIGEKYANFLPKTDDLHSHKNKTLVLIISYMRSGTSFLGKIFDENDDTLYVFEPLFTACKTIFPAYKPLIFVNGTTRLPDTSCEMYGLEVIRAYLSCDLGRVDTATLGSVWRNKGKQTSKYCDCFGGSDLSNCLRKFIKVCQESMMVVLKVIRARLSTVLPLLQEFSNLKVLHLVRDPRGILQSRYSMGEYYHRDLMTTGTEICGHMLRDIEMYNSNNVRDRVMQVRYEDIAEHPLKMANQIYKWVGQPIPKNVLKWIKTNTNAKANTGGHLGTSRANSSRTATGWRNEITWGIASYIDTLCGQVLDLLGYIKLSHKEMLRNWTIPLRKPPGDRQLSLE